MSILQLKIPGTRVVDLFAGSGALGLEALSRGAVSADFVEKSIGSIRAITRNLETLGAGETGIIRRADAMVFAKGLIPRAFDLAFADPPYEGGFAAQVASIWLECPFASILSVEHSAWEKMPGVTDTRKYGSSAITFYRTEE